MTNEYTEAEIYWRSFAQFSQFNGYPGNDFIVRGWKLSQEENSTLPEFLNCELSRDNTPTDPIIFHCHNAFISALQAYDWEEATQQYNAINRRQQKITQQ